MHQEIQFKIIKDIPDEINVPRGAARIVCLGELENRGVEVFICRQADRQDKQAVYAGAYSPVHV